MNFSVDVSGSGLLVRASGNPSEDECRSLLADMKRRRDESSADHALVEVEVAFGLDLVATMALVKELDQLGFSPTFRIALLLLNNAALDAAEFAELAAGNRGRALRTFTDRASAVAWLSRASSAKPPH